jgi:hypothetical protein
MHPCPASPLIIGKHAVNGGQVYPASQPIGTQRPSTSQSSSGLQLELVHAGAHMLLNKSVPTQHGSWNSMHTSVAPGQSVGTPGSHSRVTAQGTPHAIGAPGGAQYVDREQSALLRHSFVTTVASPTGVSASVGGGGGTSPSAGGTSPSGPGSPASSGKQALPGHALAQKRLPSQSEQHVIPAPHDESEVHGVPMGRASLPQPTTPAATINPNPTVAIARITATILWAAGRSSDHPLTTVSERHP